MSENKTEAAATKLADATAEAVLQKTAEAVGAAEKLAVTTEGAAAQKATETLSAADQLREEKKERDKKDDDREILKAQILALATTRQFYLAILVAVLYAIPTIWYGRTNQAAIKEVDDKSEKLDKKVDKATDIAINTEALVNSKSLTQMKMYARSARERADDTGLPQHIALAEAAEQAVKDHEAAQKEIDARRRDEK